MMNVLTSFLAIMLIVGSATAMPPHPDRWGELSGRARQEVSAVLNDAGRAGVNAPGASAMENLRNLNQLRRDDGDEVVLRVCVILVDFADNAADRNAHPVGWYDDMLFSIDEYQTGSMTDWFLENSLGEVEIQGDVVGWYRMPQNYAYYVNGRYGLGAYPRNAQRLAEDAIRAADGDLNYRLYDNDDDGYVEGVFIVHAGPGAEEDPENADIIWSHAWQVVQLGALDGVRFRRYSTEPENGRMGVFGHEAGHALFGLPDLYDTTSESAGLGFWSMMAYGSWGDDGRRPVHLDAWCKRRLGWADLERLDYNRTLNLPPAHASGRVVELWNPEARGGQYFLAEYRVRAAGDAALPAAGLLIYHCDESMQNNDHPWWPGNEGQLHNLVALEQADGRWDLEQFNNVGDAGDPYPGSSGNRIFNADSRPSSRDYQGDETGIVVRDIRIVNDGLEAVWEVGVKRQVVELRAGWSLMSLQVVPPDVDVPDVVRPLRAGGNLLMVKDELGRFYAPGFNFNNIPRWDAGQAYLIKLNEGADLTVDGEPILRDRPIALTEGWRFTAYYPDYQLGVPTALAGLGGALIMAKDGEGRFYRPEFNFNNIPPMQPGLGYMLKLSRGAELVYPPER